MRPPILYSAICPKCGQSAGISVMDSGLYWLADTEWKCPYCRTVSSTGELQEVEAPKTDEEKP